MATHGEDDEPLVLCLELAQFARPNGEDGDRDGDARTDGFGDPAGDGEPDGAGDDPGAVGEEGLDGGADEPLDHDRAAEVPGELMQGLGFAVGGDGEEVEVDPDEDGVEDFEQAGDSV